jgi:hypothetical protein
MRIALKPRMIADGCSSTLRSSSPNTIARYLLCVSALLPTPPCCASRHACPRSNQYARRLCAPRTPPEPAQTANSRASGARTERSPQRGHPPQGRISVTVLVWRARPSRRVHPAVASLRQLISRSSWSQRFHRDRLWRRRRSPTSGWQLAGDSVSGTPRHTKRPPNFDVS